MPPSSPVFLIGLAVGTSLLMIGLLLGFWLGRKTSARAEKDREEFLGLLKQFSSWTNEYSGDVSKFQSRLASLREQFDSSDHPPTEEVLDLLSNIMEANQQLQSRLDTSEQKLETQTDQLSSYLTEARTDALTGLWNRRAFDDAHEAMFAKWNGANQLYSLGLIDIDHFKHINDTYGHPAGDAVLVTIASELKNYLGDQVECVARYGGEEFAVISKLEAKELATLLDECREQVSAIEVRHEGNVLQVTLSSGASEIDASDSIGQLVRRADEALYAAKLGGRNRVYLHDGTLCRCITQHAEGAGSQGSAADRSNPGSQQARSRIQERLAKIVEEESRRVLGES